MIDDSLSFSPVQKYKSVCVYCGSSNKAAPVYKDAAISMGRIIGQSGMSLVYGGGSVGLMGLTADNALKAGGKVIGIIPEHIQEREVGNPDLTELYVVDSMHARKQMMVDYSDAFIVLPGGVGTLDEFFEIITWWQLGLHDKPIILVNINNYWDALIEVLGAMVREHFLRKEDKACIQVVSGPDDVLDALAKAPTAHLDPQTKWI